MLNSALSGSERFDIFSLQQNDAFNQLDQKSRSIVTAIASNEQNLTATIIAENAEMRETFTRQFQDLRIQQISEREKDELLDSLFFDSIFSRQEDIPEVHRETFQWIFQRDVARPWYNFVDWLEQSSGVYWIKGKAGSGKSTLMKLICEDIRTEDALQTWAKDSELLIASFFFWSSGTVEQKSTLR